MTSTQSAFQAAGLNALAFARGVTTRLFDGTPDEHSMTRACPKGHHARWIAGHLAWTDNYFLTSLAGHDRLVPESYDALFGMGSEVSDDESIYPPMSELRDAMKTTNAAMVAWFASKSDDELLAELPDNLKMFAPNFGALMGSLAAHEGIHAGQLTVIRAALGLERVLG